jgi:hypothetical protein
MTLGKMLEEPDIILIRKTLEREKLINLNIIDEQYKAS